MGFGGGGSSLIRGQYGAFSIAGARQGTSVAGELIARRRSGDIPRCGAPLAEITRSKIALSRTDFPQEVG